MVILGIGVAAVVAFLLGFAYYSVVPVPPAAETAAADPERPMSLQLLIEVVRCALTACLVAGLLVVGDWDGPGSGVLLGLALTVLPVVLLAGSVVHERVPIRMAVMHAGDWVIKLVAIGAVTGFFT